MVDTIRKARYSLKCVENYSPMYLPSDCALNYIRSIGIFRLCCVLSFRSALSLCEHPDSQSKLFLIFVFSLTVLVHYGMSMILFRCTMFCAHLVLLMNFCRE